MAKQIEKLEVKTKVPFEDAWKLLLKVGVAAHKYGSTSNRLEIFLANLSKKMGR